MIEVKGDHLFNLGLDKAKTRAVWKVALASMHLENGRGVVSGCKRSIMQSISEQAVVGVIPSMQTPGQQRISWHPRVASSTPGPMSRPFVSLAADSPLPGTA